MNFLNLKFPILQAPIGSVAGIELAAAVSNAGAMGSLALTWESPKVATDKIKRLKAATENVFFVNFVLGFPLNSLDSALEAGAPVVTFSWGQPGKLVKKVHRSNAKVGIQIATLDGAKQALDSDTDFIICQGVEAGGHVQSTTPLTDLLNQVVEVSDHVPVVAAGGLSNGKDLHRVLQHGAQAGMLGTRFVACLESNAHPVYKQALVDANSDESVYTLCFDGSWPYAAHRVLRNETLNDWESAGCPPIGRRPNENEVLSKDDNGTELKRYSDDPPLSTMQGNILGCCLYSGTGCGSINDIPAAQTLVTRIWSEYQAQANI